MEYDITIIFATFLLSGMVFAFQLGRRAGLSAATMKGAESSAELPAPIFAEVERFSERADRNACTKYEGFYFLPCPFCGAKPRVREFPQNSWTKFNIECDDEATECNVYPSSGSGSIEEAANTWNRRTDARTFSYPEDFESEVIK